MRSEAELRRFVDACEAVAGTDRQWTECPMGYGICPECNITLGLKWVLEDRDRWVGYLEESIEEVLG